VCEVGEREEENVMVGIASVDLRFVNIMYGWVGQWRRYCRARGIEM
jgi:hypothetical protein